MQMLNNELVGLKQSVSLDIGAILISAPQYIIQVMNDSTYGYMYMYIIREHQCLEASCSSGAKSC